MEKYKLLLKQTVSNEIQEIVLSDDDLRKKVNLALYDDVRVIYPTTCGKIKIEYNVDYEYYYIPKVTLMSLKTPDGSVMIPGRDRFIVSLQKSLDDTWYEYTNWFRSSGMNKVFDKNLINSFKFLLIAYKNEEYDKVIKYEAIVYQKLWSIINETDGPDVESIELSTDPDYYCTYDEWPPLQIGKAPILLNEADQTYIYSNGDIVAQTITNVFEQCKKEIYR